VVRGWEDALAAGFADLRDTPIRQAAAASVHLPAGIGRVSRCRFQMTRRMSPEENPSFRAWLRPEPFEQRFEFAKWRSENVHLMVNIWDSHFIVERLEDDVTTRSFPESTKPSTSVMRIGALSLRQTR